MTRDTLDDLLDSSAPATRAADDGSLTTMIRAARAETQPTRRRTPRVALGVGIAALLVGGAGVAVATDGFAWAPWVQDPVGSVSFTMAGGFDCELRFSQYSGGQNAAFIAKVNRTLEDWYRSTDVVDEARTLLPAQLAAIDTTWEDDPGADMSVLSPQEREDEIEHRAWSREWLAWDLVVSELEAQALRAAGISVPDERFVGSERVSQIQCFDESGDLYLPGLGS